jgi:cytochrome c1
VALPVAWWLASAAVAQTPAADKSAATPSSWLRGTPEEKLGVVAAQLRGFDHAMFEVGYRYSELHWAGRDRNWDYAAYQVDKIKHVIELAMERREKRAASAKVFLANAWPGIKAAVAAKDPAQFQQQFALFTAACNACHAMEKMPFIVVRPPEQRLSPVHFAAP